MFKFNITFIIVLLLVYNKAFPTKIPCPSHCKCDIFEKYRRATCKNQSLVSVEADIPIQVEFLDLSYNLVRELHDHNFIDLNFTSLKFLNLSHNKIGQIHMNAFSDMNKIKSIDLSYNNIEYLLENWFWNIPNLQLLYLQGNNLMKLREGPILESKSLKVLNMSTCSIPHIHEDAFSKLPNLEILDLSKNNLIQLNVIAIKPLQKLKILKLGSNAWHCNNVMTNLTNYCKNKKINCTNICTKIAPVVEEEKFQKMVVEEKPSTENPESLWIYGDDDDDEDKNKTLTPTCSNTTTDTEKSFLLAIIEINPVLALTTPFFVGLILGFIIACCAVTIKFKPKTRRKKQISRRASIVRNRRSNDDYAFPLVQQESFEATDSTPVVTRKNNFINSAQLQSFT